MKISRTLRTITGCVVATVALVGASCSSSDKSADTNDAPATAPTTAAPVRTDQMDIFCTNAKPLGFNNLADLQPLTVTDARELRVKLNLIQASAPDEVADTLVTIRKTTDAVIVAVEDGVITDNESVVAWAATFDVPTIDASLAAVPVMGAYITENCP